MGGVGRRVRTQMLWGLVDQGCSSAANFGLTVVAARMLGPVGLGEVFVGFTVYLLALSLQRALISDPLVVVSAALSPNEQQRATRAATTATLVLALGAAVLTAAVALTLPSGLGNGLMWFVPWILPALPRDLFRTVLFRDERGAQAAINSIVWVLAMAAALALTWNVRAGWAVVGSWGLGSLVAAALGFARTQAWPARPAEAWRWWRDRAWPLGRWLGVESVVINTRLQLNTMLLAGVLGAGALGGLRAAESLFALLTLIGPGLAMVGLPALTRALEGSRDPGGAGPAGSLPAARSLAARISGIALAIVAVYLIGVGSVSHDAMRLLFGPEFVAFVPLIVPIGVAELVGATGYGYALLLKACAAGRELFLGQLGFAVSTLALSVGLAVSHGVEGAAWGFALGSVAGAVLMIVFALRVDTGRTSQAAAEAPAPPLI